MKQLYWNCQMGAAGDMLASSLLALEKDPQAALAALQALGIPGVRYALEKTEAGGLCGLHLRVTVGGGEELPGAFVHHHHAHEAHGHHHSTLKDICETIDGLQASDDVKSNVKAVYDLLAQAESRVHGEPVELVHFHEVGALDAVADVAAVCLLLERLGVEAVAASPVHVGMGKVHCAHGILPVPAPATAELLTGIPTYGGEVEGELCTPTGAALLRHFCRSFGPQPLMCVTRIGCGIGTKRFQEGPNFVRALLGETEKDDAHDTIVQLETNLDDMTPEWIAFACERLLQGGAKDVFTTPIGMKKGRTGTKLTVLCAPADKDAMTRLLFKHTTTLGVREAALRRSVLRRESVTREADGAPVRFKTAAGYGTEKEKVEFDDLSALAKEKDISLFEAADLLP